ncbi:MAG: hypothetical protein RIB84_07885 [Sneathiellaceae bacterium]
MSLIVSDASPLIVLARSDLLGVLAAVAGQVILPDTVMTECTAARHRPGAQAILRASDDGLIDVRPDIPLAWPGGLPPMLDAGELAAIALARQLECGVLKDERIGRRVARQIGIPVIGSAGILLAAKAQGHVVAIAPILAAWQGWGHFLGPDLLKAVLARAGEGA